MNNRVNKLVRFQAAIATNKKMAILRNAPPCSMIATVTNVTQELTASIIRAMVSTDGQKKIFRNLKVCKL
jgi:hypothetical protein